MKCPSAGLQAEVSHEIMYQPIPSVTILSGAKLKNLALILATQAIFLSNARPPDAPLGFPGTLCFSNATLFRHLQDLNHEIKLNFSFNL